MAFLELDRVSKRYGEQFVVDDMRLDLTRGEFVSLLGPSGCGKTTTLQMIAGFVPLSSGAIRLDGKDLASIRPSRRGLGIVFQSYALFPHMTAAQNVAFGLQMQRVGRAERETRVREIMALVGLAGFAERYPRRMSGGQQQRVALARALVVRPPLLLLDEPLSNLDAKLREEMQIELRQIQRTLGTTTILVTHDQSEALALSDRIVVMSGGRVEQIGPPNEVYERPATAFVAHFLGKTNAFEAECAGSSLALGGLVLPAPPHCAGRVRVSVRPEKISFAAASQPGLEAVIRARIFQGDRWLFQGETGDGPVLVIRQNDGAAQPGEGEQVLLTWRPQDMQVEPA